MEKLSDVSERPFHGNAYICLFFKILVGGNIWGQIILQDDFTSSMQSDDSGLFSRHDQNWLISPGSEMEQVKLKEMIL